MARAIVVTGISNEYGWRVASQLEADEQWHVVGLDTSPALRPLLHTEWVKASPDNTLMVEFFKAYEVSVLVHCAVSPRWGYSESVFEQHVMGSIRMFAVAAAAGVKQIVVRGSTEAYGATHRTPGVCREETPLRAVSRLHYVRDMVEIERYVAAFRKEYPATRVSILRFAPILGPTSDTPLGRYLASPVCPTLLGFDPMMQLIDMRDVGRALVHAVAHPINGAVNIAATGVSSLNGLLRRAGKAPFPLFHALVNQIGPMVPHFSRYMPLDWNYLRYSCVASTERMRTVFEFEPRLSLEATLDRYLEGQRMARYDGLLDDRAREAEEEDLRRRIEARKQGALI